jgi:hypothetical protein
MERFVLNSKEVRIKGECLQKEMKASSTTSVHREFPGLDSTPKQKIVET